MMPAKFPPPGSPGEALTLVFADVTEMWRRAIDSFITALTEMSHAFDVARLPFLSITLAIHGEDFVVDQMGISRCDIRSITLDEVRLWNHRRIPLDLDRLVQYAGSR